MSQIVKFFGSGLTNYVVPLKNKSNMAPFGHEVPSILPEVKFRKASFFDNRL